MRAHQPGNASLTTWNTPRLKRALHFPLNEGFEPSQTLKKKKKPNSNHPPPAAPTLLLLTWFHQPLQHRWELWSERSSVLRWDRQCSARRSLSSSPARAETDTLFTCKPKQRLAQSHERFICQLRHQFLVWVFFLSYKSANMNNKGEVHPNMKYPQYFPIHLLITVLDWTRPVWQSY